MQVMLNTTNHLLVVAAFLTLCVLSFVHVFIFPLYELNPRLVTKQRNFLADYEHILCKDKTSYSTKTAAAVRREHHQQNQQRAGKGALVHHCPRDGIVTVYQGGRLGNQMFEYAGVWAVARRTGLDPYVPGCIRKRLDKLFENLSVPTLTQIAHCPLKWTSLVRSLDQWTFTNQSILLYRYYQELEVVIPWLDDIRQEFTIKRKLNDFAQAILSEARNQYIQRHSTVDHLLFVGVHVRRTDIRAHLWRYRHTLVGAQYFFTAMKYFENKYKSVIFVVISDDPEWCVRYLNKRRNVFIASVIQPAVDDSETFGEPRDKPNTAEEDFAIMVACNHSIIDYGTFGVWGAILAGGETIVHNITGFTSTKVGELLPNWHLL